MCKILLVISLIVNVLLYTGTLNLGQYRNYVDKTMDTLKETSININTPAGTASGSAAGIKVQKK